ncbi:hypothetical protein B0H13DRAFT_2532748 [Mycena leptocephala]|nr:hypothetical protein B0H13DRAFT_2532748 [Mycena leptocephala]
MCAGVVSSDMRDHLQSCIALDCIRFQGRDRLGLEVWSTHFSEPNPCDSSSSSHSINVAGYPTTAYLISYLWRNNSPLSVSDVLPTSCAFRYHYAYDEFALLSSPLLPYSAGNGSSRVAISRSAFLGPARPTPSISSRNLRDDTHGLPQSCVAGWEHVGVCFFGSSRSLRSHGGRFLGQADTRSLPSSPSLECACFGTRPSISSSTFFTTGGCTAGKNCLLYTREVAQPRSLPPPPCTQSLPARHFPHGRRALGRALLERFAERSTKMEMGVVRELGTEKVCSSTLTELEPEMEEQEGRGITEIEKRGSAVRACTSCPRPRPRSVHAYLLPGWLQSSPHSQLEFDPEAAGMSAARVYLCAASVLELIVERSRRGVRAYPRRRRHLLPTEIRRGSPHVPSACAPQ